MTVYRAWQHHPGAGASTLLIAGFCVGAGIIGVTLRNLMFRFGTASQALSEANSRLAVAEAVESERARLAREMHDSVAKTLHGLALAAEALATSAAAGDADPRTLGQQATIVAGAARRAAAESRDLLSDLRRHTDLTSANTDVLSELDTRVRAFESRTHLPTTLHHRGEPPVLPYATAHHVLAIVSEALENAYRHADATRVTVELEVSQAECALRVRDDGVGLPPSVALDDLTRSGHFGLLGMAERAASLGGRIDLNRSPQGGAEIHLTLPHSSAVPHPPPPTKRRPHMPEQALPGPNLRILVADDNPVVRAGLAALLDGHPDLEVVAKAADGEEAIEAATRLRPDVILLDVRMPGTDGLTALPALSQLAPVMMLTYSREPEVVAEALRRGAVGYLVHGEFTAAELISAVREIRHARATVPDSLGVSYEPNDSSSHMQPLVAQSSKARSGFAARLHRRVPNRLNFGLSSREVEVMDLIASGMSNQQIAAACFISEKTVKNHINRIFAKLHSSSRSEAIAHWLGTAREGWSR